MGDYSFPAYKRGDVTRTITTAPPVHFTLEIQSFADLKKSMPSNGVIESTEFSVGNHKWQLCVYPKGDKQQTGDDNLSLNLKRVIPVPYRGDVAGAWYRFYVYDYLRSQYLIIEDSSVKLYNRNNQIWGISAALRTTDFEKPTNGFISYGGACTFGVDVFYFEQNSASAILAPVPDDEGLGNSTTFMTPGKYRSLPDQWLSDTFPLFGRDWKLKLFPKGRGANVGRNMGLFLLLEDIKVNPLATGTKLYVEFTLTMKNNMDDSKDQNKDVTHWFDNTVRERGIDDFIGLNLVANTRLGFQSGDSLEVGVTIKTIYLLKES